MTALFSRQYTHLAGDICVYNCYNNNNNNKNIYNNLQIMSLMISAFSHNNDDDNNTTAMEFYMATVALKNTSIPG